MTYTYIRHSYAVSRLHLTAPSAIRLSLHRSASILRQARERAMIDTVTGGDWSPEQFLECH